MSLTVHILSFALAVYAVYRTNFLDVWKADVDKFVTYIKGMRS